MPPGQFWRRFGPVMGAELRADIARRGTGPTQAAYLAAICPPWATPVPARLLDTLRFSRTLRQVMQQLRAGTRDFVVDHHIDTSLSFLERLALPRP